MIEDLRCGMTESDIAAFAELIQQHYAQEAHGEAMRRARHFARIGDHRNAGAWRAIADKVGRGTGGRPYHRVA